MRTNPFKGYGVALVTPFTEDGEADYASLSALVERQIVNGVDFICALGTTAETPTLDDAEYQKILHHIVEKTNGRVPIMAGCSDNCTSRLVRKIKSIGFEGVSGLLVGVPSYNKPSQEGIYRHFMAAAEASDLPVILYNVPGRTGVNMTARTTLRLVASSEKFIAIKEASGNVQQIRELIQMKPEGFDVISGDDSLTCELIGYGAAGVISVIGNAIPATFGRMVHLASEGNVPEALEIHRKLENLYGLLFKEGNPSGVKAVMADRNLLANVLRLPMTPVSSELENSIVTGFSSIDI